MAKNRQPPKTICGGLTLDGTLCKNGPNCRIKHRRRAAPTAPPAPALVKSSTGKPDIPTESPFVGHGARLGADGLLGDPTGFKRTLGRAGGLFGMKRIDIARDYHLHRVLKAVGDRWPHDTPICDPHDGQPVAWWAFAGGTSLTNAHRIVDRYSEDLDLIVVPVRPGINQGQLKRARKAILDCVESTVRDALPNVRIKRSGGGQITHSFFHLPEKANFLIVDTANQPIIEDTIAACDSWSLMGRAATDEQVAACPELGGFEVPVLAVEVTATNKLRGQFCLAAGDDLTALEQRARDIVDLSAIAVSPHGEAVRRRVAGLSELLRNQGVVRSQAAKIPRPAEGLGSGLGFQPGTAAYKAIRRGYQDAMQTVWGEWKPGFDEALGLARSLDYHRRIRQTWPGGSS